MRCPECNKYLGYRFAYNKHLADKMGYFYRCPSNECSMVASPEGSYWGLYDKLRMRLGNWRIMSEAFKNQSIARWLR
jgi:hypothetical protein